MNWRQLTSSIADNFISCYKPTLLAGYWDMSLANDMRSFDAVPQQPQSYALVKQRSHS